MSEYLRVMRELWVVTSAIGMTALVPFTVVALVMGLIRLPADPPRPAPVDRPLAARLEQTEADLSRERSARLALLVELDCLRRTAILFPARPEPAEDLIPPQNLPVAPVAPVPAIPPASD